MSIADFCEYNKPSGSKTENLFTAELLSSAQKAFANFIRS